jgi:hypothetical protein
VLTARLSRMNQVQSRHMAAAAAVYASASANRMLGVQEMSVQEAVGLARDKAAHRAREEAAEAEQEAGAGARGKIKAWFGRRRSASRRVAPASPADGAGAISIVAVPAHASRYEERTLSGRSDSAGSLVREGERHAGGNAKGAWSPLGK